jgi:hypothetical protein
MDAATSDSYYSETHGQRRWSRPTLEPVLRGRVENVLKVVESEALQLGRNIGMCAGCSNIGHTLCVFLA